jgi:hypothetical protein
MESSERAMFPSKCILELLHREITFQYSAEFSQDERRICCMFIVCISDDDFDNAFCKLLQFTQIIYSTKMNNIVHN